MVFPGLIRSKDKWFAHSIEAQLNCNFIDTILYGIKLLYDKAISRSRCCERKCGFI